MRRYEEIEHTADIGVEVYGETLNELLKNAGYALFDTIVEVATVQPVLTRSVSVSAPDSETLVMNWLRELLYLFSVEQEVYCDFTVQEVFDTSDAQRIEAQVCGEKLDLKRHNFETEIKAVTYHQFAVVKKNGGWQARIIFDV